MATDDSDRLDSWKEIAAFIGRDERTAMGWAAQQGMPVHRVPGGKRGRVFASRAEISEWLGRRAGGSPQTVPPSRSTLRRAYVVAGVLGALALLLFGVVFYSRRSRAAPPPNVNRVTFTSDAVVAWHDSHRLWKYQFRLPLESRLGGPTVKLTDFVRYLDLDHGKRRVVILVAPLRLDPNPSSMFEEDVDCFSNSGKLLWSYVPHENLQFGDNDLVGPWFANALYVSETGGKPSIWVAESHFEWANTFVVQLDAETGHATLRFVNTGVLYCLNEVKTASGTYMLAGGFNNENSSGIMAVINEKTPFAASPQTPGTRHQCVNCAPGVPDEYFVFPRTEVNRVEGMYEDPVRGIRVNGDRIQVENMELGTDMSALAIYMFRTTPTIQPISLRYDTSYDMLYRQLEKEGKIHYSRLADSPERLHPLPVSVWTPSGGWADYDVRPPGIVASKPWPISRPPRYLLAAGRRTKKQSTSLLPTGKKFNRRGTLQRAPAGTTADLRNDCQ